MVNELGRLNGGGQRPFAGKLGTGRIGVAGHSLGWMTALPGVTFKPSYVDTFSGALLVYDNGAGSPQQVALSGSGLVAK
jgi:hypothetical protein